MLVGKYGLAQVGLAVAIDYFSEKTKLVVLKVATPNNETEVL